jgi:streptogramin lyase
MIHLRRWLLTIGLAALALWGVGRGLQPSAQAAYLATVSATNVIYRFDPGTQTFITIPLPIGSWPTDIEVTGANPTQVWVADSGRGQLTRIVFTGTLDYQVTHFPVATSANNQPYRLALSGGRVWFTAPNTNRVGRLNPGTGAVDEFFGNGLPANAGLTDVKVSPTGKVWLGAETAQRLIRLTVTSTVDYVFKPYVDTRPGFVVAPQAIAIENDDSILMTVPTAPTPTLRLAQFTPSTAFFQWPILELNSLPQDLVIVPGEVWFSDRQLNELVQIELGTLTNLTLHGPITKPTGLAAESASAFWSVLQTSPVAIGRLSYAGQPPVDTVISFNLPDAQANASAIAVAADGGVWVSAYRSNLYLPLIRKS